MSDIILVAEIGSTTTLINAFKVNGEAELCSSGLAKTTVDTDVNIGLTKAKENLGKEFRNLNSDEFEMFASSSAAGGLKMTVSGLVYEMTVRAAKEAALNAGANIHLITAGLLNQDNIEQIKDIRPNIILISGGTDYGEKETAFSNIKKVENLKLDIPIIYAGNIENHYRVRKFFDNSSQKQHLRIVENVYPRVDFMNIHPLRKAIYETFEKHIVTAKGMQNIKTLVNGAIMPTPGSVMEATMLLHNLIGNVLVIDVGGATTDIHSITEPSEEFKAYSEGEAKEKRTVEGDLGVFVNHLNVIKKIGTDKIAKDLGITSEELKKQIDHYSYKPSNEIEEKLVYQLTKFCVFQALNRHVGDLKTVYTTNGMKVIPEGRDLTQVQSIVLTGGALTHLPNTEDIVLEYIKTHRKKLMPQHEIKVYKDHDYLMSSLGVLSLKYKQAAEVLLKKSLRIT